MELSMDYLNLGMAALKRDFSEFTYHLKKLQTKLNSDSNQEVRELLNSCEEISKLKDLQAKLDRTSDVY